MQMARQAAELGNEDATALAWSAYAFAYIGREAVTGAALVDRALELNANLALAWAVSGWVRIFLGEHEFAIEHLARAMRLSPLDPATRGIQSATADAHFLAGRYEDALSWAAKAMRLDPNWTSPLRIMVASHALAGHLDEAKVACARLLALDPQLRISNVGLISGPYLPEHVARYAEGLRKAGMPE